ncbi:MAG TPA: hypothetical protein VGI83_03945 [Gemmatimonadales bacterium]
MSFLDRRPGNRDLAQDVYTLKSVLWSFGLACIGAIIGMALVPITGANEILSAVLGFVLAGGGVLYFTTSWQGNAAHLAQRIHMPTDGTTPPVREYSQAESLVARGRYEEAALAFEIHCAEYSDDPDPYFRLARLYAGPMGRYEDGVTWFRRARKTAHMTPSQDLVALQSIIELYLHKIRDPRKAIPEMAHLAQAHANTPAGDAAGKELALMRQLLLKERDNLEAFTEEFLALLPHSSGQAPD